MKIKVNTTLEIEKAEINFGKGPSIKIEANLKLFKGEPSFEPISFSFPLNLKTKEYLQEIIGEQIGNIVKKDIL